MKAKISICCEKCTKEVIRFLDIGKDEGMEWSYSTVYCEPCVDEMNEFWTKYAQQEKEVGIMTGKIINA